MKRNIKPYKVISWNFNHDDIEYYDIMPFLIDSYKKILLSHNEKQKKQAENM